MNCSETAAVEAHQLNKNRRFYDPLWAGSRVSSPKRFNTWPLIESLLPSSRARLEVGPGLRIRLPIQGTCFVDASETAVEKLHQSGADVRVALISSLPFQDATFDLVVALDVVEHVEDDERALAELSRVSMPRARLLMSAPLHPERWTRFDELVGHKRRYVPQELVSKLERHGFVVEQTGVYGMRPRSPRMTEYGMNQLHTNGERAIWFYDRIFLPLGAFWQRFGKKLELTQGMIPTDDVDELFLVCRKGLLNIFRKRAS